jgi:diguanylate cyclase (GGDEF)-like protein/PAS domain S-box-containing protein
MRAPFSYAAVAVFVAAATGAGILLGSLGWPQPDRTLEYSGLLLAAILTSVLTVRHSPADNRAVLLPSFVIAFALLLLFGPGAATLAAAAGIIAQRLSDAESAHNWCRTLTRIAAAAATICAAGVAYRMLGGSLGHFVWPWQAVPIAAAVVVYTCTRSAFAWVVVPLLTRQPIGHGWLRRALQLMPDYLVGGSVAVAIVEMIDHRMWQVLPVVLLPLYFAYRTYADYVSRVQDDRLRRTALESLEHGLCAVSALGTVTRWDDTLERILGCTRDRAIGLPLARAVPALADTDLPRALAGALATRQPCTLDRVGLPSANGGRLLQVRILPAAAGATLLWQDTTDRVRAEHASKRHEERLALAAEGSNDGLWAWDLRTDEFYVSTRWKALVGLPGEAGIGRSEDWLDRVHAEDLPALKNALEAHLTGREDHFEHEHRLRHPDGSWRWFLVRGVAARAGGRRAARIAGSLTDTTERAGAQEQLRAAGFLDPLTGLCNRAVFVEDLGRRLAAFKQHPGGDRFAVLYLDLDRFKVVNDSLGHLVGDELLKAVSRRLEACLRPGDALARLGGDEFAILLNGLQDEQQANAIAFRIQDTLSTPFSIGGREVFTSASIGIAFGLTQYTNPDELMRDADTAMYHAKARGKARHELFDADMHARTRDRLDLENDLRHAVSSNALEVYYQPIVSLASGMCVGFESLVRWKRNGEAVSPATFIPIAEELGLIEPIGTWVLEQACRTFADWQRRFPDGGLDCITVNVSSRQLMQQNFLSIVEQAVRSSGLTPGNLRLEITETALMDSPHVAAGVLRELRDFGVKIYLDDFGTGYSSLSHLHKLPVDALKIDRSFVKSLQLSDRPAIVESILALARTLNTSVVAEGIESDAQARELERLGCTHAQGFLFSRPLCARSAEELLAANQPLGPKQLTDRPPATAEPQLFYSTAFEWPPSAVVQEPRAAVAADIFESRLA